ncbi:TetR family transcriptional regulator, partial [Mycobacterium sp.]|uniref:TetR family transcriptional regulator n=1 Tax=Mycobacterium sp. TaxID=1785 RepID=UPI003F9B00CB
MAVQARAEAMRQRIIDAAVDLFDEVGYGETRLTDIIDRSRVTKGAFYYHFPTKESVAAAIIDEADVRIRDAMLRSTTSRALENLVRATFVVADMVKHDQRVRVGHLLGQALSQVSAAGRATYTRRLPVIVSAVNKAIADGDLLDDLNPDQVGRTICAIGLGTFLLSDVTEEDVLVQTAQAWVFITRAIVPAQLAPYVEQFVARTAQQYTHDEPDLSAEELLKRADLA